MGITAIVSVMVLGACGSTAGGSATPAGSSAAASDKAAPSSTATLATEAVIGMTVDEATAWANERGMTVRVVKLDGESLPGTKDYRPERINVEVENGVITAATLG